MQWVANAFLAAVLAVLVNLPVAGVAAQAGGRAGDGLEITGLVIDRTITRGGRDFHDLLVGFLGPDFESPYTLVIVEAAGVGRSTLVTVSIDEIVVLRSRLNPLPEKVEALAQSAAEKVIQAIARRMRSLDEEAELY